MNVEKVRELLSTLQRDEETLRNTILNATGQLQYNRKVRDALKQLLEEETEGKKTARRKK